MGCLVDAFVPSASFDWATFQILDDEHDVSKIIVRETKRRSSEILQSSDDHWHRHSGSQRIFCHSCRRLCEPIYLLRSWWSTIQWRNRRALRDERRIQSIYFDFTSIGCCFIECNTWCKIVGGVFQCAFRSEGPFAPVFTDDQSWFDTFGHHSCCHSNSEFFHVVIEVFSIDLDFERNSEDQRLLWCPIFVCVTYIIPAAFEFFNTSASGHVYA